MPYAKRTHDRRYQKRADYFDALKTGKNSKRANPSSLKEEAFVKRTSWILAGIVIVLAFVVGVAFFRGNDDARTLEQTVANLPVAPLGYCGGEQVKPCIVSFGTDAFDNMLINILLPDLSFPGFYMKISHSAGETVYICQRLSTAVNTAYCAGKRLPPGESLRLRIYASKDDTLLAEGNLPIIGLALPTVGVVVSTPQHTPTEPVAPPTFTEEPAFLIPTPSEALPPPPPFPTIPTKPSYP